MVVSVKLVVPKATPKLNKPTLADATWNKPLSVNVPVNAVVLVLVAKPTAGRGTNTPVEMAGLVKVAVPAVTLDVAIKGATAELV